MFYYTISTTYQKIGDVFCSVHFSGLSHGVLSQFHRKIWSKIGLKYTWFGPGYISNMYFKMIANHPKYSLEKGGDLAFTSCTNSGGEPVPIRDYAFGDKDGNPIAQTGW